MTRSAIGGRLDLAALAALAGADRARQPASPDRETARVAARDLRAQGLTALDIAAALHLGEDAVCDLLGEPSPLTTRR